MINWVENGIVAAGRSYHTLLIMMVEPMRGVNLQKTTEIPQEMRTLKTTFFFVFRVQCPPRIVIRDKLLPSLQLYSSVPSLDEVNTWVQQESHEYG